MHCICNDGNPLPPTVSPYVHTPMFMLTPDLLSKGVVGMYLARIYYSEYKFGATYSGINTKIISASVKALPRVQIFKKS